MEKKDRSERVRMTEQQRAEHNKLFEQAAALVKEEIPLHDRRVLPKPGWWLRRKLRRALSLFERALELNPENWSAMWLAGKVHQRLGEETTALSWFERAYQVNPSQPDVAREASLLAMDVGRSDAAIVYAFRATQIEPESAGLQANLALAYLLAARVGEAQKSIESSLSIDGSDTISQTIKEIIGHFASTGRKPPAKTEDLQRYWAKLGR